jgi:hypothetical protein
LGTSKIETYLGFCIRARKIVLGADSIERQKKGVFLLVADGGIGKNSLKPVLKAKEKFACPLIMTEEGVLGEKLHRPSVKAAAITDDHLAKAILSVVDSEPQFKFYSGGNN